MKWLLQLFLFFNFPCFLHAVDYSSTNVSTKWVNNDSISQGSWHFTDGSTIRLVLLNISYTLDPSIGCGFYGNPATDSFYFTVFAVVVTSDFQFSSTNSPQILWTANRANPVKENATLDFTGDGDLVLRDADGTFVWSSDTSRTEGTQMIIYREGTLVLAGDPYYLNFIVWRSWDYPTDTWLPGQKLFLGKSLIASVSASNWTPGSYYLSLVDTQLSVFIESNIPQIYYNVFKLGSKSMLSSSVHLSLSSDSISTSLLYDSFSVEFQYLRLDPDGHLRVYQFDQGAVSTVDDIFTDSLQSCENLTVCGNYGICSNGQCSCPAGNDEDTNYFKKSNSSLGCLEVTPLSCQSSHLHIFIEIKQVSSFGFVTTLPNTDIESCKQACLKNCSCKAALFRYELNTSSGNCSLPSQIFSLMSLPQGVVPYNSTSFIKVQSNPPIPKQKSKSMVFIAGYIAASIFAFLVISTCVGLMWKRRSLKEEGRENNIDEEWETLLNLPARFTYEYLKSATDNFHTKLGGGGFGSVYAGTLSDGTNIAVKRLDRFGQGKKEFVAEVKTIGCVHHVNLVRLVGFCAQNSHRLLVYEYMSNGSLEKWIFNENPESALRWEIRKKIILNIAKGLVYLHEECQMRIAHLDIKPQNILLNDNFNAKLSDFGLARLIDINQSQVITQMRGTRGYMAPEWLSRMITEKVDVYSFGVVILEVVCGRRNMDFSQDDHLLLPIVKQKAEENRLYDLVDNCSEDMQQHLEEAEKMLRIGIWCLQCDFTRRPSMSVMVKVLEGVLVMEPISDYSFLTSTIVETPIEAIFIPSNPQPSSVLSGPR